MMYYESFMWFVGLCACVIKARRTRLDKLNELSYALERIDSVNFFSDESFLKTDKELRLKLMFCLQARSLKVSQQQGTGGTAAAGPVPQPPRTNKLPPMDAQKNQQTDEILNAILPPRYMVVLSCACALTVADQGEGRGPGLRPHPPLFWVK